MQPITACAISTSCCGTRTLPPATASRMAAIIGRIDKRGRQPDGLQAESEQPREDDQDRPLLAGRAAGDNDLWNCRRPPVRRAAGGRDLSDPLCLTRCSRTTTGTLRRRVLLKSPSRRRISRRKGGCANLNNPPSKITQEGSQMKFRPLHDRVVVRRLEAEEKTAGGIIIPDTAKEKPMEGEVIAVGPGARDEAGKLVPLDVKAKRPHSVRQVVGHRSEARRRGAPDHEGVLHHGHPRRPAHRQAEGGLITTGQSPERNSGGH